MNSHDIVDAVATKNNITKVAAKAVLSSIVDEIQDGVKAGKKVVLAGFGTFEKTQRAARKGRNPQTGEEIKIPATKYPKFRPGKTFRDSVNRSR